MTRAAALTRRFDRLSIQWRLALTSAGLTLAILLLFAVVVGTVTTGQLRSSFDDELRSTTADLQERLRLRPTPFGGIRIVPVPGLVEVAAAGGGALRLIEPSGQVLAKTRNAPDLGPPRPGAHDAGDFRVVTRPIAGPGGEALAFIQYARPSRNVDRDVARLQLFLVLGVLGGTMLAFLAGLAVARRAIGPIARLTQAAREVERTRDPTVTLPQSAAEDEVADLAHTLEEMLAALAQSRAEAEAALDRQREFVADASHELRTPLTSILANLELLEAALEGEDAEVAGSALRSSRRMRRLVGDLLLLARADAGRGIQHAPVDLGDVLREAAAEVEPVTADHVVRLETPAGDAERVVVQGARDDLHRLALNLIENAARHTPPGTEIEGSVSVEDGAAVLAVSDSGPGVPAGMRERVFERFARAGADGGGGGSGLGLAIVRAVADTHGGSVSLSESASGGACFEVRLPLAAVTPPPLQAAPSDGA